MNGSLTPPEVTIAADQPAFTAEIDDVTFTLTRTEDPAAALTVGVALTQDQDLLLSEDLAQNVDVRGGRSQPRRCNSPLDLFVGHTVTEETTLTATVQAGSRLRAGLAKYGKHPDRGDRPGGHGVDRGDRLHVRRGRRRHRHRHRPHRDRRAVAQSRASPWPSPFYYTSGLAGSNDLARWQRVVRGRTIRLHAGRSRIHRP